MGRLIIANVGKVPSNSLKTSADLGKADGRVTERPAAKLLESAIAKQQALSIQWDKSISKA
ncbi:TPA: hypothetical protein ACHY2G_006322 [Pseudomonas aeruginosa]